MKAKEMLEHYKLHGERVDEVLYQMVMTEIHRLEVALQNACNSLGADVDDYLEK